jgi:hypothetical protein
MEPKKWMAVAVMVFGTVGATHANVAQPGERSLTSAVTQYLSGHGDLCVGKFTWPRVVTEEDRLAGTNDAVQLPVLERLGLVESTEISQPAAAGAAVARRYSLTAKGRQYYLQKKRITLGAHDQPVEHDKDLCVAHLTLDKVVKWSPPEQAHGHLETMVHYTYRIKSADWTADTEVRKVFPVVDRIIRGQGNLLMSVNVRLQDGKWMPVLPGQ